MLYFGYGSLVNRDTRDATEPFIKASLRGWERQWAHRAHGPWSTAGVDKPGVCALTVAEAGSTMVDGVIGQISAAHIAGLDQRETGYHRITVPASEFSCDTELSEQSIAVYVSSPEQNDWADPHYPILMSYVECVLAGFRQQYGDSGVRRFMQTTSGWDKPLFDDRSNPLYPRAVTLSADEQRVADALLTEFISIRT